jgi:hypothetical protein
MIFITLFSSVYLLATVTLMAKITPARVGLRAPMVGVLTALTVLCSIAAMPSNGLFIELFGQETAAIVGGLSALLLSTWTTAKLTEVEADELRETRIATVTASAQRLRLVLAAK